jgi:DNA-binding response OmpR family regulator
MTTKPHIFLVEDDQSFGAVLKSYLEINDFEVDWIDDGQFALDQFKKSGFDVCILDVMLPNVDGFTIASEIRKINIEIPILFLTAKNMREDVIKGYRIGADDYITKPFDTEVLIFKLRSILKRQNGIPLKCYAKTKTNYFHAKPHLKKYGATMVILLPVVWTFILQNFENCLLKIQQLRSGIFMEVDLCSK